MGRAAGLGSGVVVFWVGGGRGVTYIEFVGVFYHGVGFRDCASIARYDVQRSIVTTLHGGCISFVVERGVDAVAVAGKTWGVGALVSWQRVW